MDLEGATVFGAEQREIVQQVKTRVRAMLDERSELQRARSGDLTTAPSAYWSDFCRRFRYFLGMADEDFDLLRLHTYHLDGDNYQTFFFGAPELFRRRHGYDFLVRDIPDHLRLSAPRCLGEYGFDIEGRTVNGTTVRMQRVVNTLHRCGVLDAMSSGSSAVLEIGGGYGALAYHLSRIVPGVRYYIVDLPEVLLFSSIYLSVAAPERTLYLWDAGPNAEQLGTHDFVLVPNYALSALRDLKFELVVNVASFQEMRSAQLREYVDFCASASRLLYSWNQDSQDRNTERPDVTSELKRRFDLDEVAPSISARGRLYRVLQRVLTKYPDFAAFASGNRNPEHEYICTPRTR